jgi:hypothetical protein
VAQVFGLCHIESGVDQLVEIIKVLGTPSKEQLVAMVPNLTEFNFPPCPRCLGVRGRQTIWP